MAAVAEPHPVSLIADNGGRLYVYADPSDLEHVKTEPPADPAMLGADVLLYFGTTATGVVPSAAAADVGEDASVHLGGNGDGIGARMCARVSPRTRIAIGHAAELAVDTSRLYFFDPQTRDAVDR